MDKDLKAFLKIKRRETQYRPVKERIQDYKEVISFCSDKASAEQVSRCMDCGTPFCHWACPLGNYIPEWNDLVSNGQWEKAFQLLEAVNNFPEIIARVCPALCEYSCVLGLNDDAVTIRENELAVIEYAFNKGWVKPKPPKKRTGKKIAIVGSGPSGLAAADQLNKAGHTVIVFEKDDKIGGILRYGIPDFKLEKHLIDRRIKIWQSEGIIFKVKTEIGKDYSADKLKKEFDAVCLAIGSRQPRDLKIPGRDLKGIHFAMDFLIQSNKAVAGEKNLNKEILDVEGKNVVVIGGGDTGADCVGVARRRGAKSIVQIELMPKPPEQRTEKYPWPIYPLLLKTSTSHQEGCERYWEIQTEKFLGQSGRVQGLSCVKLNASQKILNSEFELKADKILLALGFIHPEHKGLIEELNLTLDSIGNIKTGSNYMTSVSNIFAAGDAHRGQSLAVWAVQEAREAASAVHAHLTP
ncbi:MAG: glutamate synthase subunit beta [Candidatus Omnitrophota bacterium]